ncbi:MAG TPA: phosphocholine cytidylyltransferase family protein [Solirubrobacteraceae bacterium]|nr:phosphocholine cytidylyltransferase family protein [Solirubrobacteraceae bacterium]
MKGLVLAAGQAQRLRPLTDELPKTLLPVAGGATILDLTLANLRAVGIEDVAVVTGFAAERIEAAAPELERRHGVRLELVHNDRPDWNNAYSLWVARDAFRDGALLVNGDTVHPVGVEHALLAARGPAVLLAVDDVKPLGDEEMKVLLSPDGRMQRIHKGVDPAAAHGEYIGVTLIEPAAAEPLAEALEATWRRDATLYYEDGFQAYADGGGEITAASIGEVSWIEVDDHADLARAREIASAL